MFTQSINIVACDKESETTTYCWVFCRTRLKLLPSCHFDPVHYGLLAGDPKLLCSGQLVLILRP